MTLAPKTKPVTTIQHKKRSGAHHRRSKQYSKPYWPYLPLLAIVGIGLILNSVWTGRTHVLGDSTTFSSAQLLANTNAQRRTDQEANLRLNNQLDEAAQAKAEDMARQNFWSHDTPDGKTPWTFITATGYQYQAAGENLAFGFDSSGAAVNGWMHSAEHRANILNSSFEDVGFGIASSPNYQNSGPETIVVAMYAEPAGASTVRTAPVEPLAPSAPIARIQTYADTASWSVFVAAALGAVAAIWFVLRYALAWKRVLVRSEEFIVRHRFFDVIIVGVATVGFVLTRTAGFIH